MGEEKHSGAPRNGNGSTTMPISPLLLDDMMKPLGDPFGVIDVIGSISIDSDSIQGERRKVCIEGGDGCSLQCRITQDMDALLLQRPEPQSIKEIKPQTRKEALLVAMRQPGIYRVILGVRHPDGVVDLDMINTPNHVKHKANAIEQCFDDTLRMEKNLSTQIVAALCIGPDNEAGSMSRADFYAAYRRAERANNAQYLVCVLKDQSQPQAGRLITIETDGLMERCRELLRDNDDNMCLHAAPAIQITAFMLI